MAVTYIEKVEKITAEDREFVRSELAPLRHDSQRVKRLHS